MTACYVSSRGNNALVCMIIVFKILKKMDME